MFGLFPSTWQYTSGQSKRLAAESRPAPARRLRCRARTFSDFESQTRTWMRRRPVETPYTTVAVVSDKALYWSHDWPSQDIMVRSSLSFSLSYPCRLHCSLVLATFRVAFFAPPSQRSNDLTSLLCNFSYYACWHRAVTIVISQYHSRDLEPRTDTYRTFR